MKLLLYTISKVSPGILILLSGVFIFPEYGNSQGGPGCSLNAGKDTTICIGESIELIATYPLPDGLVDEDIVIEWTDDDGNSYMDTDVNGHEVFSQRPRVTPTENTIYTVKGIVGENLIDNPDFENVPDPDTLSDYGYETNYRSVGYGEFAIGDNANYYNEWFRPINDKFTEGGDYMIFDGAPETDRIVFKYDVSVEKGREYVFSVWLANIHTELKNPFRMLFYIGNEELGNIRGYDDSDEWFRYHTTWVSNTDGVVTIKLINDNTNGDGNDFALDHIVFAEICEDEIEVSVSSYPVIEMKDDTTYTQGDRGMIDNSVVSSSGTIERHEWAGDNNILNLNDIQNPAILEITPPGEYVLSYTATDQYGCSTTENINVIIEEERGVPDGTRTICPGKTYRLSPITNDNLLLDWTDSEGNNLADLNVAAGEYTATATTHDGDYVGIGTMTITYYSSPKPMLNNGNNTIELCPGASITLDPGEYQSYLWHDSTNSRTINVSEEGQIFLQVTNNYRCVGYSDTVTVSIIPEPEYNLGQDTAVCPDNPVKLSAGEGYLSYRWFHNGIEVSDSNIVEVLYAGEYESVVNNGCHELRSTVSIAHYPVPQFSLIDTTEPGQLYVTADDGTSPYLFSLTGQDSPYEDFGDENHLTGLYAGEYLLHVKDDNGCLNAKTVYVPETEIFIPNFFTPNGDGYNDTWIIDNLELERDSDILIHDRFGNLIVQYKYAEYQWDGTMNGKPLPQATYWYIVKVPEKKQVFKGSVTIKR